MKDQLLNRLDELKKEYESGQKTLMEHEGRALQIKESLLRISGAIQVLEEEIKKTDDKPSE